MIEKVIQYKASDGTIWGSEESALKYEDALVTKAKWQVVEDHIDQWMIPNHYTNTETLMLRYLQNYTLFIYSELRKIIPKEQLKELDKE